VSAEQGAWDDVREVKCENGTGNYLDALTHELYTVYNCPVLSGVHRDPFYRVGGPFTEAAPLCQPEARFVRRRAIQSVGRDSLSLSG
jgi:hypothetical protein